jgi:hypothetical protein
MAGETREVSLRELIELMRLVKDEDTFRWFQDSYIGARGVPEAGTTYRVSMGQARRELGVDR